MINLLYTSKLNSPIGELEVYATQQGIRYLCYADSHKKRFIEKALHTKTFVVESIENEHIKKVKKQLNEYFKRERKNFDIALDLVGTPFQLEVWHSLRYIPYGKTISYLTQAKRIDNPKGVRAVANANGRNPISIIVPCHRVIGSNGKLTGYAGGIERKKFLLRLENPIPEFDF